MIDPKLFLLIQDSIDELEAMHETEKETFYNAQKEYAQSENIFANFIRQGERLQLQPEKVLMIFAIKHFDGIIAHINGHKEQREKIDGRITDLKIYLSLLQMMINQKRKG